MAVRAKFVVAEITQNRPWQFGGDGKTPKFIPTNVKLEPVYKRGEDGKNAENEAFGDATPSGSLQMLIQNDQAASQFEVGKEYYLDITPAE